SAQAARGARSGSLPAAPGPLASALRLRARGFEAQRLGLGRAHLAAHTAVAGARRGTPAAVGHSPARPESSANRVSCCLLRGASGERSPAQLPVLAQAYGLRSTTSAPLTCRPNGAEPLTQRRAPRRSAAGGVVDGSARRQATDGVIGEVADEPRALIHGLRDVVDHEMAVAAARYPLHQTTARRP